MCSIKQFVETFRNERVSFEEFDCENHACFFNKYIKGIKVSIGLFQKKSTPPDGWGRFLTPRLT